MASNSVRDGVVHADQATSTLLFSGQKLWFAHTIPQRSYLMHNARLNGATIVELDKHADIRLVDHTKKGNVSGTYSYRYVELSIRNGKLEPLQDHAIGMSTRTSRPVGSTTISAKSSRTRFTNEDDQLLWDWVKPFQEMGGAWKGNEIYKSIESSYPQHTYQSWRDRWIKTTQFQTRQISARLPEIPSLPEPPMVPPTASRSVPTKTLVDLHRSDGNPFQEAASQARSSGIPDAEITTELPEIRRQNKHLNRTPAPIQSHPGPGLDASQRSSPGLDSIACSNCYTKESNKWQKNKRGELLCHDCAVFLRIHKVPRPSTAAFFPEAVNFDMQRSNHLADSSTHETAAPGVHDSIEAQIIPSPPNGTSNSKIARSGHVEQRSPSFQPESPTFDRRLQTNKGRKRSAARLSQSQLPSEGSSNARDNLELEDSLEEKLDHLDTWLASIQTQKNPDAKPGKSTEGPKKDTVSPVSSKGKSPLRRPQKKPEIADERTPTMPQGKITSAGPFSASVDGAGRHRSPEVLPVSIFPSRAARKTIPRSSLRAAKNQSSASASEDNRSEDNRTGQVLRDVPARLHSESMPAKTTSPPQGSNASLRDNEHSSSSSPGPASPRKGRLERFEINPETMDEYETATEGEVDEVHQVGTSVHRRLSTQALFDRADKTDDNVLMGLEIPEPVGGWKSILGDEFDVEDDKERERDSEPPLKRVKHDEKGKGMDNFQYDDLMADGPVGQHDDDGDADDQIPKATLPPPKPLLSTWLKQQKDLYPDIPPVSLSPILFKAIESTSFDFSLATTVVADMVGPIPRSTRATLAVDADLPLPQNLAGVWTADDDNLLMSPQTRDLALVITKHGRANCTVRFRFLDELFEGP